MSKKFLSVIFFYTSTATDASDKYEVCREHAEKIHFTGEAHPSPQIFLFSGTGVVGPAYVSSALDIYVDSVCNESRSQCWQESAESKRGVFGQNLLAPLCNVCGNQ